MTVPLNLPFLLEIQFAKSGDSAIDDSSNAFSPVGHLYC